MGLGIPYGILGMGSEMGMHYASIVGGYGWANNNPGWSAGLRGYFLPPEKAWRPHATVVYGTTVMYTLKDVSSGSEVNGTVNGLAFYLAVDHDVARPGGFVMTYGLGYITHESLPYGLKDTDIGVPIKILFGWNYRFGI